MTKTKKIRKNKKNKTKKSIDRIIRISSDFESEISFTKTPKII